MKRQIHLNRRKIEYMLRRSKRARRMRLAVYCDGTIVVTAPFDLKETVAERFIREKMDWLFAKIAFYKQFKGKDLGKSSQLEYLKHKEAAQTLAEERVAHFNAIYKFQYNRINIKNQKTRWGSCSKRGNLNFNYKIALLPQKVADYVIVHELCHLREFNHSKKFWSLVAKAKPDYKEIQSSLRELGLSLR